MYKSQRRLALNQLQEKTDRIKRIEKNLAVPHSGWIHAIRLTLGMSLRQLANRMGITLQSVAQLEVRERNGTISLNRLRELGNAMGMKLVYGFVPHSGTVEDLIMQKARLISLEIIGQSAHTMELEDQGVSATRIRKQIDEMARELVEENPGRVWD